MEVGCGSAPGFGLLGAAADFLVGSDIDEAMLREAHREWRGRFGFVRADAEHLPFVSESFDVVLFYEASYYVGDMESAFEEIIRVLAPGGTVAFVNANPERPDFIRSPHSVHYHSADEFRAALSTRGFSVTVEGTFPIESPSVGEQILSVARRFLEATSLTPRTLKGRALLKRLVHGRLIPLPADIPEGFGAVCERATLSAGRAPGFKVIYVTGSKHP